MTRLFASAAVAAAFCAGAIAQEAPQIFQASAELDPLSNTVHDGLAYAIMEAKLGPDPAWADDSLEAQGDGEAEIIDNDTIETEIEVTRFSESEVEEIAWQAAE